MRNLLLKVLQRAAPFPNFKLFTKQIPPNNLSFYFWECIYILPPTLIPSTLHAEIAVDIVPIERRGSKRFIAFV